MAEDIRRYWPDGAGDATVKASGPVSTPPTSPVSVSLQDLENGTVPHSTLEAAFGPTSLGIIVVHSLPEQFSTLRARLLSYSSHLANLPQVELAKLEDAASHYLVGWSRGKETLRDGRYDTLKGSYYANPVRDSAWQTKARELYPNLPEYNAENVWPADEVLPGFRAAFEELCELIVGTAVLVARACDRYAAVNVEGYREGYLERVVRSSVATKARLLHYFAAEQDEGKAASSADAASATGEDDDDWCATHLDHGCLTGLTSAMFVDESTAFAAQNQLHRQHSPQFLPQLPELDRSPDPKAGLYIHSRSGDVVKVGIPRDCLAFQTGLALERITRGKFRAVPHFVRGVRATAAAGGAAREGGGQAAGGGERRRVARNTLAVFTQPNLWEVVDEEHGLDFAAFAREIVEKNH